MFSLCLPATEKDLPVTPDVPETGATAAGVGHVLLVEDDDAVAAGVAQMLSDLGYTHERVGTGDAALERIRGGRCFDLVLSDMVMPGALNGLGLATELHALEPGLPVILTTGFSEAAATANKAGFRLLSKPYGLDELAATLAGALAAPRSGLARAQATGEAGPEGPPPIDPTALQTLSNLVTRMAVPVQIAGQGPFHFVIDTGATRTTLSRELAESLNLSPGPEVVVHGVVSAERAATEASRELVDGEDAVLVGIEAVKD